MFEKVFLPHKYAPLKKKKRKQQQKIFKSFAVNFEIRSINMICNGGTVNVNAKCGVYVIYFERKYYKRRIEKIYSIFYTKYIFYRIIFFLDGVYCNKFKPHNKSNKIRVFKREHFFALKN